MATVKFFQTKANDVTTETFAMYFDVNAVGFNRELFAPAMANKLLALRALTERAAKGGRKLSFSATKPLWFEFNSGADKIVSDLKTATALKCYVKGAANRGEGYTKTELTEQVNVLLDAMEIATAPLYTDVGE